MKLNTFVLITLVLIMSCSDSDKNYITGSGVFEGNEIIVSSKLSGELVKLYVQEGEDVKTGDIIAQIDVEKLTLQQEQVLAGIQEVEFHILTAKEGIAQAEENYQNVEKRYQRIKAIYSSGSATQQQMDDIDTQYKAAQAALKSARSSLQAVAMKKKQIEANLKLIESQIADGTITASAGGIIVDKFVEQGEMVGLGLPVVAIADLSQLWIKLYVTEMELGFIRLGATAEITIDSFPDKKFSGKVVWISPKAEFTPKNVQTKEARADLVYAVKIMVPNAEGILKIGMPADIRVQK